MTLPLSVRAALATLIPLTVAGVIPWLLLDRTLPLAVPSWRFLFAIPMMTGIAIAAWSIALFAVAGRGTLSPIHPPTVFVARGPYRMTRNPMYVAVQCWLWGLAGLSGARPIAAYALLMSVVFHAFVVLVEEPGLRRRFGASYDDYLGSVPRWLGRRRSGWRS